jgi:hypothetical protein
MRPTKPARARIHGVALREHDKPLQTRVDAAIVSGIDRLVVIGGPEVEDLQGWCPDYCSVGRAASLQVLCTLGVESGDDMLSTGPSPR